MQRTPYILTAFLLTAIVNATAGIDGARSGIVRAHVFGNLPSTITEVVSLSDERILVAGWVEAASFTIDAPGHTSTKPGADDGFVAIMSTDCRQVHAFTWVGGVSHDRVTGVAVDPQGRIVVTGTTQSNDLPTTTGVIGQQYLANTDGFVIIYGPKLDTIYRATYICGSGDEVPYDVATDLSGDIYVCGSTTSSSGFPTNNGYDKTYNGQQDAFLLKLTSSLATLAYSTYFGGEGNEAWTALALESNNAVAVTGWTTSTAYEFHPKGTWGAWPDWSRKYPFDYTFNGIKDAVVTKFTPDGAGLTYSAFFGGSNADEGVGVSVDARGRVTIVGQTNSVDLPATAGFQPNLRGGTDGFIAVVTTDGRLLHGVSYLGGTGDDIPVHAHPIGEDQVMVVFRTTSTDLNAIGTASTNDREGGEDGYLAIASASALSYATTFGWDGVDQPTATAIDARGNVFIGGRTTSRAIITTGVQDEERGMVSKFVFGSIALVAPRVNDDLCIGRTTSVLWSTSDVAGGEAYFLDLRTATGAWDLLAGPITTGSSFAWTPTANDVRDDRRYAIRVRSESGLTAELTGTFGFSAPMSITQQPRSSTTVCAGDSVKLSIGVAGTNVKPQWRKNAIPIPGATSFDLVVHAIEASSAGVYDVSLSGGCQQTTTSTAATIAVTTLPTIVAHPRGDSVMEGYAIELSVQATGTDVRYQWYRDGMILPGRTSSGLRIENASPSDAGRYACTCSTACGNVVSDTADVVVLPATSIAGEPTTDWHVSTTTRGEAYHLVGSLASRLTIDVVDVMGRIMQSNAYQEVGAVVLDVAGYPSGRYWVVLLADGRQQWLPIDVMR